MNKFFNFYTIDLSGYEEREIFYFVGPASYTENDFDNLCKSLIPEATLIALAKSSNADIENYDGIISMFGLIIEVSKLLETKGFKEIVPKTSSFSGSGSRIRGHQCPQIGKLMENVNYQNNKYMDDYEFDEETGDRR